MVVFTCNHCGDSLHKPKVEKHYSFACRTAKSLTCVDCFKDFRDEEYVTHTKCLTEDERYAAKGTYVNGIVKKGEAKQESWVEMIKSILEKDNSLKPSCRNLLNTISHYSNIPRKKPKFMNFIKSSSGGRVNMKDVEEVWNIIEKYKNENKSTQSTNGSQEKAKEESQNGSGDMNEEKSSKNKENEKRKIVEEAEDSPKKKKHKKDEQIEEPIVENNEVNVQSTEDVQKKKKKNKKDCEESLDATTESVEENPKFNFQEKILEIVTAKQSITLKKLQKKVLNAYMRATGETEVTPKAIKKFNKKLKKIPNLEICDDKVTIVEAN